MAKDKQWLYNVDNGRILRYTEVLAKEPGMVPCNAKGERVDIPGATGEEMIAELKAENAALKGRLSQAQDEPSQVVIANLRMQLQRKEQQVLELSAKLRLADGGSTTVEVAGELEDAPEPSMVDELERFAAENQGDKKALDGWAEMHLGLNLDGRKSWSSLLDECRRAVVV